ncbi:MAG: metal-dependent transcriptional regulator [Clostridia bacterium]|nr:metal-dependent transcriptional regulator [Clostridia bacterium]
MAIHKSGEDYLEAMLMMQEQYGYIRSIDVANKLGVTKPSVSYATKQLRKNGYITMDKDSYITLTPSGMIIAERMYTRHKLLSQFFMTIGVSEKSALEDACKIEHDLSQETFDAVCRYVKSTVFPKK